MVCTAEGSKERGGSDRAVTPMASKPLHNFSLPCLKWGSQRQMRCVRINSPAGLRSPSPAFGTELSPPPPSGDQVRRSGGAVAPNSRIGAGIGSNRKIKALDEQFLNDWRAKMDKIRDNYLGSGAADGGAAAAEQGKVGSPGKPWNLRTRRAACKAPIEGGKGRVCQSPQRSEGGGGGGNGNLRSVRKRSLRSGAEKKSEERATFCPTLKRKEVEEDFLMMTGQRPPRKPKKRPRSVQKQLDVLFPGFWLGEVFVDTYKVPEIPDNTKR